MTSPITQARGVGPALSVLCALAVGVACGSSSSSSADGGAAPGDGAGSESGAGSGSGSGGSSGTSSSDAGTDAGDGANSGDGAGDGVDSSVGAATVTVGQSAGKASATYFYYDPSGVNAHAIINEAIAAAAKHASASSPAEVLIEAAARPYVLNGHVISQSNVNIAGASRDSVTLKIAGGITPVPYDPISAPDGWGGVDTPKSEGAIINVWSGISNVRISNLTFDGSWDDLYSSRARGAAEFVLINIYGASHVLVDHCKFIHGADDGILCTNNSSLIEVSHNDFDMVGHDCFQVWSSSSVKYHHNVCAMRTNSGVRFAGSSDGCEAYANEFYTGSGGAAGVELETGASNVKIYNNYFHDISGAGSAYGAIGYGPGLPAGDAPTGGGHQYYDNLIVNCAYGVSNVPSTAIAKDNVVLSCPKTIVGGTSSDNITADSGYAFSKFGSNANDDTYWVVTSGPLATAFSGIKVGIDPKL